MSEHQPTAPTALAARRAALVRQCADQRDQLALEVYSLRAPLDGRAVQVARGLAANKLRLALAAAGVLGAVALVRRMRNAPLLGKASALWGSVQPVIAMLRRSYS